MFGFFGIGTQELLCLAFMGAMVVGTILLVLFVVKKSSAKPNTPEERDYDERDRT